MTRQANSHWSEILKTSLDRWQAYSECLSQALDLSDSDRVPWLDALAARDAELAAAIISALAARIRDDFSGFLAAPLLVLDADSFRPRRTRHRG